MKFRAVGWLLIVGHFQVSADSLADAEKSAEEMVQLNQQKAGSPATVEQNLLQPLTTNTSMYTLDGQQTFSAKVQPQAGQELLKLIIQPLPSGDVKILSIAQDTQLSGKIESYLQPNLIVSGVCANGFIRCEPGSWNNCQSFIWTTNDKNQLATQPVALSALGGCYCINNSCGTGLAWSNLNDVLSHLGGGAVGAIVKKQPLYSVGAPKIADTTVTYYGHNGGNNSTVNLTQLSSSTEPQRVLGYAKNPQSMEDDKASQATTDPNWQLIKESQASETPLSFVNCRVDRIIKASGVRKEDILTKEGGNGTLVPYGPDRFVITLGNKNVSKSSRFYNSNFRDFNRLLVLQPDRIISATLTRAQFGSWIRVMGDDNVIWTGAYPDEDDGWDIYPQVDFTAYLKKPGHFRFGYQVVATRNADHYIDAVIQLDLKDRLESDQIINGCSVYEDNKEYLLVDEIIDGVNTFKNYLKTGLQPVAQTRTINGPNSAFKVTRDFFHKERRYLHKNKAPQKYEFDFERTNYIQKHSTDRYYHDQYRDKNSDQLITTQGDLFLTASKPHAICTPTCKTKKLRPQNDVVGENYNVTGEKQRDPVTYDFFYRSCKNGICQLESGEVLVKDCQCLEEFGEAAAMMQMMRMAGKDLICSTGATQTLGATPTPQSSNPPALPNWVCGKEQAEDGIARLQHFSNEVS